jgi:hypothetical protein
MFLSSKFSLQKIVLLEALQLLMLFVRTLTYFEPKLLLLIIFYNGTFLILKILIIFSMNISIYIFLAA